MTSQAKQAVVIGAGSGMGRAAAIRLHQDGYDLLIADVTLDSLRELGEQLGARIFQVDITQETAIDALVVQCQDGLDALVHSAGLSMSMASFERIMAVNLDGTTRILSKFAPIMKRGGAGVCFASIAGHLAGPISADIAALLADDSASSVRVKSLLPPEQQVPGMAYSLSKLGVLRRVEKAAAAWGRYGARINSVSPGLIETPMGALERQSNPEAGEAIGEAPIPRLGTPEDVANVVAFLLSPQAGYMTGCDVIVDGGWVGTIRSAGEDSAIAKSLASGRKKV